MRNKLKKLLSDSGNPITFKFKKESVCLDLDELRHEIERFFLESFYKVIEITFKIGDTEILIQKARNTTETMVFICNQKYTCYNIVDIINAIKEYFD